MTFLIRKSPFTKFKTSKKRAQKEFIQSTFKTKPKFENIEKSITFSTNEEILMFSNPFKEFNKIMQLVEIVNNEMGAAKQDKDEILKCKIFTKMIKGKVIACLICKDIQIAHRINNDHIGKGRLTREHHGTRHADGLCIGSVTNMDTSKPSEETYCHRVA
jgi:hypothetical protein